MVTLIDSTVSVTTRHSDNAPIASEVAMASVSRDEATAGAAVEAGCGATASWSKSFKARANHPRR